MDLTPIFKASIMAVKMRKKNLPKPDKNRILQSKPKDEFSLQAKEICQNITTLRDLLIENRAAYMKFAIHLKGATQMTDQERDLIDQESEKIFNFYTQHLAQLRADWKRGRTKNKQHSEHVDLVIDLLTSYLRGVHNMHLSQKKYRMQYELDTYKFLKLAANKKQIPARPGKEMIKTGINNDFDKLNTSESDESDYEETEENVELIKSIKQKPNEQTKKVVSPKKVALDEAMDESTYDDNANQLSPEDIQMYESENVQLYNELQGLAEEVEQIEKNVVDIARLQEIFTEKVVLQKHDIERIANAVVGATENVKDANEQIKQAIQRNASLRVWTLFFLLVISFTLLFLDWYND